LLIFLSRTIDVSIGTIRIILVGKGLKWQAAFCGFFEVLVWLIAITQIMQHLSNFIMYIAYASGFAFGTYVGVLIENRLAFGYIVVQVITKVNANELVDELRRKNIGNINFGATTPNGRVRLVYIVLKRKEIRSVFKVVKEHNPNAYYIVQDIRSLSDTYPGLTPGRNVFSGGRFLTKRK
jgi:uncharacterized protein YebE (UPF0316 family)